MSVPFPEPLARSSTSEQQAYVVGRNEDGHWVAVETHGLGGGLFRSREAAEDYASFETGRRAGAVVFAEAPLRLSI